MNIHSLSKKQVEKQLGADFNSGLTKEEADSRLKADGKNTLSVKKKNSFLKKLVLSFCDRMTLILIIASVISFITAKISGETAADTYIILAIVLLNGLISVFQESKAEKALEALKRLTAPKSKVLRDGKETEIDTEDIVKGDIVILKKGCFVPADGYIISCENLSADESPITGESLPSEKTDKPSGEDCHISEIKNGVFAGTVICSGHGRAVVTATGMDSYMGSIAGMIAAEETQKTPLQTRLNKIGGTLGNAALIICAVIFAYSVIKGMDMGQMFLTSVSLAVASIPEGLPAIVTVILSLGVKEMADKKAVVKKLPAVEALGTAAVICSDKTGTITQNKMTVTDFYGDENKLKTFSLLCNDMENPTETALYLWADGKSTDGYERVKTVPFSSKTKHMITVHKKGNKYLTVKKGAPEKLLEEGDPLLEKAKEYGAMAKRVIAFCCAETNTLPENPENCIFVSVGICGIEDPPRKEVGEAVKKCRKAGIKPVMITGDRADTAAAIGKSVGILRDGEDVFTEEQLKGLTVPQLAKKIKSCSVFARTTPEFKVKIVEAFKYDGKVVAMTGDGVNDAPALKKADIGCAMGITGTDVAKEAADIILTDDNFSTIIEAVRYGRGIYDNIRRSVRFLLSCNIGEILTVFVSIMMSLPSPLQAIQLLWVNLVTDSLPAIALGSEKTDDSVMFSPPALKNESLFAKGLGTKIFAEGIMVGFLSLCGYLIGLKSGDNAAASTMCFGVLSFSQLFHAFNMRSDKPFWWKNKKPNTFLLIGTCICILMQAVIMIVPRFASLFGCVPLTLWQWVTVGALSVSPIIICETVKIIKK